MRSSTRSRRDARDALEELRRLATELYPPLLDAGGLVVALRSAGADAGIVTHVEAEALPEGRPELAATVYFCCLEALRNVALHAGSGAKARVSVAVEEDALVFEIADDGCGFVTGSAVEGRPAPNRRPGGRSRGASGDRVGGRARDERVGMPSLYRRDYPFSDR